MSEVRRDQRYYIQDKDHFLVKVEANGGRIVDCFLNDISASGACIILDAERKRLSISDFRKKG